jgi:beta-galactosidase
MGLSLNLFGQQTTRTLVSLNNSGWKFIRQDIPGAELPGFDDKSWLAVSIPHDWNGGIDGVHNDVFTGPKMYLGTGWYRAKLNIGQEYNGKRIVIQFEAISLQAQVWLNGKLLGKHKGGYTAFSFDITDLVNFKGENVLAVKASNANDSTVAPWMKVPFGIFPTSSDYAVYGGIYRDVNLIITNSVKIENEYHSTFNVSEKAGSVKISTRIKNYLKQDKNLVLKTDIIDANGILVKTIKKSIIAKASNEETISQEIYIENPQLWSSSTPYTYKLKSTLLIDNKETDQTISNLGFRWYTLKNGQGFKINGKSEFLHGVNRHQDREGYGYALSNKQHFEDMELIKSLGFNFMRHAHYPCDEAVLNACDSLGIMVWLEIPASTCISPEPAFLENAKSQLNEMITEHYNHPCIIIWGIGNESDRSGASTEAYTNSFFKELNNLAHELDPTRPTTGCNFIFESDQAIPDVYAPQDWTGWYDGNFHEYMPSKMIGEYGADSYIPSHDETFITNSSKKPWTQEYACLLHEYKVSLGESRKDSFPGQLVWVAFDFASPRVDRNTNPIPNMNEKGLVLHDHKTLKDVAYFYRSFYTCGKTNPIVYIVSHSWTDRIKKPGKYNIWVYSNCDSVVLYNGNKTISFGARTRNAGPRGDTRFQWDNIDIQFDDLVADGYVEGNIVAIDKLVFSDFKK